MVPWAEADAREALRLKESGLTWRQVGAVFGKSRSSAEAAVRRYLGFKCKYRDHALCGDPIGIEQPEVDSKRRARIASTSLSRAINALIDRMPANDVAEMLGKPHLKIPGTENIIRGQAAERRWAA